MTARIVRGYYRVTNGKAWRTGPLFAGHRIKTAQGEWLERIECLKPLYLTRGDLMLYPVLHVPCFVTFLPGEICGPIDVRAAR